MTVGIKADSIEPAELIYVKIGGDSVKQLINLIEKREHGILLDFGSNGKIPDSARDMITECSKTYSSDYGIMLAFYEFYQQRVRTLYGKENTDQKHLYDPRSRVYKAKL